MDELVREFGVLWWDACHTVGEVIQTHDHSRDQEHLRHEQAIELVAW